MEPQKDDSFQESDASNNIDKKPNERIISDFTRPGSSANKPSKFSSSASNNSDSSATSEIADETDEANSSSAAASTPNGDSNASANSDAAISSDSSDSNHASEAAVDSDETAAAASSPTVSQPVFSNNTSGHSHKKTFLALVIVILLVIVGGGLYALQALKPSTNTPAVAATVKKDIANVRYVTSNSGWDKFYPDIDTTSNYEESNREIFEGLVRYENRTQIVPLLATGWTNPDPKTWVFTLKQGVKFHTGREMTASDVKASFDAMKGTDLGDVFASSIDTVTATSKYQVTIKTTDPDATLLNKLTNLYVFDTTSTKKNDPINGTGAYTIKPGTTGSANSLELVAFDQYHGGRPHVRSVSFVGIDAPDHGKAYADNKADIMSLVNDGPTAAGSRKYTQINLEPLGVREFSLNTLKAGTPLANLKVRQALAEALDQNAIAKARGISLIAASQLVPKAIPGYDPSLKTMSTGNAAAAKQLLADAGFPKGFSMKLTYFAPGQAEAAEIAKEAAAAGITITLDPQADASKLGDIAFGGKTDGFLITQTSDILDSSDVLSTFDDTANYKNQTVIDLVSKAQSTLDASKRLTYLQQANKAMAEDAGVIPLFTQADNNSILYNPSYFVPRDIENNNLGIYFWKMYGK